MAAHTNVAMTSYSGDVVNPNALLSPDPREVSGHTGAPNSIVIIDLGSPKIVDTIYLGYNTFRGGDYVDAVLISNDNTFATSTVLYTGFAGDNSLSVAPVPSSPRWQHGVLQVTAGVGRYLYVRIAGTGTLGVLAAGNSFTARWGHEMGSGRPLLDRSSVEALPLGGFGIDAGAITGGYQWSFGDLQQSEITALYQIIKSVGQSRSVLVIEDPDFVYDTPTAFGGGLVSGSNKNISKTSGANGYNAGAYTPLRQGRSVGISWENYGTGGRQGGFYPGPSGTGSTPYAVEFTNGNIWRYLGAAATLISSAGAAGDRSSVIYDEGRQQFRAYKNGVLLDAIAAAPGLDLYPTMMLYTASNDQAQLFNVFDLGYEDRIHWGLLQKLDTFERADPANWRWSLSVGDWV